MILCFSTIPPARPTQAKTSLLRGPQTGGAAQSRHCRSRRDWHLKVPRHVFLINAVHLSGLVDWVNDRLILDVGKGLKGVNG